MHNGEKFKHNEWRILDRLIGFIISNFYRLKIARKLMLGYCVLLALLVIISESAE